MQEDFNSFISPVDSDHMQHVAAVIREILVHSKDIINFKDHLPSLPSTSTSPNFREEFISYASGSEWVKFHKTVVREREGGRERERERERGEIHLFICLLSLLVNS